MGRFFLQGRDRWKRLSHAQRLQARAYWWEGAASALLWLALLGIFGGLWLSLRERNQSRKEGRSHQSEDVSGARRELPPPLREEWDRQKARLRAAEMERQWIRLGISSATLLCVFGQLVGLMLAKRYHDRAACAATHEPEPAEPPADLLHAASPVNESSSP
jgi:hypothetical protein